MRVGRAEASFIISMPRSVLTDQHTLTHHYHPESGVHLETVHSISFHKAIMTCIYHFNILQSIFTALKIF